MSEQCTCPPMGHFRDDPYFICSYCGARADGLPPYSNHRFTDKELDDLADDIAAEDANEGARK